MRPLIRSTITSAAFAAALLFALGACAQVPAYTEPSIAPDTGIAPAPLPQIVSQDGKHALLVDGKPFLILGMQANNSSNYPAMLPDVWAGVEDLGANTLQMPIAWEQVEPVEGEFDFSFLDTLVAEARERNVRLVLLWYGTWKNTSPGYVPSWVKLDNARFPRMVTAEGETHYVLSPNAESTFEADKRAFLEMMQHLKAIDPGHTVIMIQVQNESGSYRLVRDHSETAEAAFNGPVPDALLSRLGKPPGTWRDVFGPDADEYFQAWSVASYIGRMADAGREILDLPMYANAALRDPIDPQEPGSYASGGPTHNVIDIWKAAAPALDLLAPDIYIRESRKYTAALDHYDRADNPLFVAETGNNADTPRFFFSTLGKGGIGFSPFGLDYTGYSNYPLGAKLMSPEAIEPFAANYALVSGAASEWARLAYESGIWGVARPDDDSAQLLNLGDWTANIQYNEWQFGFSEWTWLASDPIDKEGRSNAGALIARIDGDTFLVTGRNVRVSFGIDGKTEGTNFIYDKVEEVRFENGEWKFVRLWNGDQVDYGLNLTDKPVTLRVSLATY